MMIENLSTTTILDAVASPLLVCQNDNILFANRAAETLTGYTSSLLQSRTVHSLIYSTSANAFAKWYDAATDSQHADSLKVRMRTAAQALIWVNMSLAHTLLDGSPVRLITLQDITAIRETETELFISTAYRDLLLTNTPDVVVVTDIDGVLIYVSPAVEEALGYDSEALLGSHWSDKVHPQDAPAVSQAASQVVKTGERVMVETRVRDANGAYIWFEAIACIVVQKQSEQMSVITVLRNIDQHKLTEITLREREQSLRLITDNMHDIVIETAPDGIIRYISPSCTEIMGYLPAELYGKPQLEQVHPDDIPSVLEYFSQVMTIPSLKALDMRFKHKAGHFVWVEINCRPVMDSTGTLQSLVIVARAIAERKAVELAFQQSQHLLQQIMETTPTGIYLYDIIANQCIFYNHNGALGYSDEDIKRSSTTFFDNRVHPEDRTIFEAAFARLENAKSGEIINSECRMKRADGQWRWIQFHDTVFAMNADGKPTRYLRTSYDVTERKLAEAALQENQYMLQQINDVAPVGIYIYDVKLKRDIYHNRRAVEESDISEDVTEPNDEFYQDYAHPDDAERHKAHQIALMELKDGEVRISEQRLRMKNGTYRWFIFRDIVFKRDEQGRPSQFLGSMQDITERKEVEESLRQSENMLQKITDTSPFGVYIYDVKQRRDVYQNRRLLEDIKPKKLPETPEQEFYGSEVHPDDLEKHAEHRNNLMAAKDGDVIESEVRALSTQGAYEWLYFRDIVFARDEDGKPSQFLGSMQNITARKQAEQALRENQNLLKQITETVPLDIYIYDVDLKRNVFFNRAENLGYPVEVLDNQNTGDFYSSLVHPDDLEAYRKHTAELLVARDGELVHAEYRMKHASGEWRWYYFRDIIFARHADNTPRQFLGSVQDITQRKQTEEALRQSQELLSKVTSTVPTDIYIFDVDLNKGIYSNRGGNLGIDQQTSLERNADYFKSLVHPDDLALYEDFNRRLETSPEGVFVEGEFRMRHDDGSWMWRNYRNTILHRHADGTPAQYLGTVEDVTRRKTIEEQLRQSQHLFERVAKTVPMQVIIYDYDLKQNIFENRPSDLGFSSDVLANASQEFFTNLVHPDDRPIHDEIMHKLETARDGEMLENEFRMRGAGGIYAWHNYRYTPFARRSDGSLSQFLCTILNVDERRKASESLSDNEEKLRLITDNIRDLVALTDVNLHYRYVSPSHHVVLGYAADELVGKSIFDLVHPDDIDMLRSKAANALEKRQTESAEFRFRHHDGYYLWLETNGSLVGSADGQITGAVFASRDVSERRWMQRAMLEQEKLLIMLQKEQELSSLKTRMMSRLSHELRTPLSVISTSADLLDAYGSRMTDAQRAERLQQIRGQVRHFTSMLDNMALVVKGISYSMDFAPAPYDFEMVGLSVIKELKDLMRVTHTVEIKVEGDGSSVNSDEQLMRLILTHLLSNAMKYSPPSNPILVKATLSETAITLLVKDQGMGIVPDELDRVFEPFFRGTNIGEVPGLGVGLSIVKDAVDSMQGSITINSEPGKGTDVTVMIPLGGVIGVN